jgi:hypothetical protein
MLSRSSHRAFAILGFLMLLFLLTLVDAASRQARNDTLLTTNSQLVKDLGLTDLCLFTEARYTRHPSQADLHSAFQDHPMALEHFPSGSLLLPPRSIPASYEYLDKKTTSAH